MKSRSKKDRPARILSDDACPTCGSPMINKRTSLPLRVNGEDVRVPSVSHRSCPKCGDGLLDLEQAKRLGQDAIEIYRRKYGLLSTREIRAIRSKFDLTQEELARLLRLGANTVSRWESGRNVQSASMDLLLRLIRDLPGSIVYLREHAT
jgi:putative zinc finger/helix-turn-helix YgiT family protein